MYDDPNGVAKSTVTEPTVFSTLDQVEDVTEQLYKVFCGGNPRAEEAKTPVPPNTISYLIHRLIVIKGKLIEVRNETNLLK